MQGSPPANDVSREYPARPIVGVGAVILIGDPPGVVLVKRRFEPLAGRWSLPGGTVEVGETLEDAATREVLEETGLIVSIGPVVEVFDRILRDEQGRVQFHFVVVDYLCHPAGGTLRHGSDVAEVIVADSARLEPFELTGKALAVIARGVEMAANG